LRGEDARREENMVVTYTGEKITPSKTRPAQPTSPARRAPAAGQQAMNMLAGPDAAGREMRQRAVLFL